MCYGMFIVEYQTVGSKHEPVTIKVETKAEFDRYDLELAGNPQVDSYKFYRFEFKRTRVWEWQTTEHVEHIPEGEKLA
jgi:hypothetical protein